MALAQVFALLALPALSRLRFAHRKMGTAPRCTHLFLTHFPMDAIMATGKRMAGNFCLALLLGRAWEAFEKPAARILTEFMGLACGPKGEMAWNWISPTIMKL